MITCHKPGRRGRADWLARIFLVVRRMHPAEAAFHFTSKLVHKSCETCDSSLSIKMYLYYLGNRKIFMIYDLKFLLLITWHHETRCCMIQSIQGLWQNILRSRSPIWSLHRNMHSMVRLDISFSNWLIGTRQRRNGRLTGSHLYS